MEGFCRWFFVCENSGHEAFSFAGAICENVRWLENGCTRTNYHWNNHFIVFLCLLLFFSPSLLTLCACQLTMTYVYLSRMHDTITISKHFIVSTLNILLLFTFQGSHCGPLTCYSIFREATCLLSFCGVAGTVHLRCFLLGAVQIGNWHHFRLADRRSTGEDIWHSELLLQGALSYYSHSQQ